jgi:hypothetical protein
MPPSARAALTFTPAAPQLWFHAIPGLPRPMQREVHHGGGAIPTTTLSRFWRRKPATLTLSRWMPTGSWVSRSGLWSLDIPRAPSMPPTRTLAIGAP